MFSRCRYQGYFLAERYMATNVNQNMHGLTKKTIRIYPKYTFKLNC